MAANLHVRVDLYLSNPLPRQNIDETSAWSATITRPKRDVGSQYGSCEGDDDEGVEGFHEVHVLYDVHPVTLNIVKVTFFEPASFCSLISLLSKFREIMRTRCILPPQCNTISLSGRSQESVCRTVCQSTYG